MTWKDHQVGHDGLMEVAIVIRAVVLVALLPGIAQAACPEGDSRTPFTLAGAWSSASSVYHQPDGVTIMRVLAENGRIDEIVFNRGLLLVAERAGSTSYTVDYQGDIDALFDFEYGAEITLHVRQISGDAERAYAETYVIGETVPLDIGECRYDVTVIDSFAETESGALPQVRVYYARALGFVLGREIYYSPESVLPEVSLFFHAITDDPAALVPR